MKIEWQFWQTSGAGISKTRQENDGKMKGKKKDDGKYRRAYREDKGRLAHRC